jgi:PAS domain S-box-containing protein
VTDREKNGTGWSVEKNTMTRAVDQKPVRLQFLLRICAMLVAGSGLVALLGWVLGTPSLSSLGSNGIPMAPSTAVLFVLYAVAVFLPIHLPSRRGAYWAGVAINVAGAVVALLLLILSYQSIRLETEHFGIVIEHTANDMPIGHMSPVTALCFLLAALSYLATFSSARDRPRRATAARWLAGLVIAIGFFLALGYLYEMPFFYGGSFIPPAAHTSAAFMVLGILLLNLAMPYERLVPRPAEPSTRTVHAFKIILALVVVGVTTSGFLYYRSFGEHYRTEVAEQLSAITDLQVSALTGWRAERMADAEFFFENAAFASLMRHWLDNPGDKKTEDMLRDWLSRVQKPHLYDRVSLLDARGVERLSIPETPEPIAVSVQQQARESQRAGNVVFLDFYRDHPERPVRLAVLAPIRNRHDRRPLGTVVLRIDPHAHLYPLIRRWPLLSRSAETFLVRREGNAVLFLNTLRFVPDPALTLRIPLTQTETPAVKAALGQEGITDGLDYRGVPVVAMVRAVPDSPWFLVAKEDTEEVYAPLQERLWMTILLVGTLLASAATGATALWRQQQRAHLRELLTQEVENAKLLRMFYDLPFIGMAHTSPETKRWLQFNDRLCEILGYPRQELATKSWAELTHPEDLDADTAEFDRVMRGESEGYTMDKRFIRKDGATIFATIDVKCVRGTDGATDYFIAMIHDITQRKQAEANLRLQSAALEAAANGIVISEPDGTISWVNPAFTALTGYGPEEVIGKNPRILKSGKQDPSFYANLWSTISSGNAWHGELINRRKDGTLYTEEQTITPMRDAQGEITHFIAIKQDITERKLLEVQAKRTDRLAVQGQLLGGIAHELKNPLFIVTGRLQLMKEKLAGREYDSLGRDLQKIEEASRRMATTTQRFLSLATPTKPQWSTCSIHSILDSLLEFICHELVKNSIQVVKSFAPDLPTTWTEPQQLNEAFMNLVLNAMQAMSSTSGKGTLTIATTSEEGWIAVRIQDDGPGIAPEHMAKLFEPFFTTKPPTVGTGLGLWTVRTTLAALNGTISCESEWGHGAIFTVRIPIVSALKKT